MFWVNLFFFFLCLPMLLLLTGAIIYALLTTVSFITDRLVSLAKDVYESPAFPWWVASVIFTVTAYSVNNILLLIGAVVLFFVPTVLNSMGKLN